MIDQFYMRKVEGVVMFNRFYEPDIDINTHGGCSGFDLQH